MKNNRDILLGGFALALWTALYFSGLASREEVLGLGLMLLAFLVTEWPKKSKTPVKIFFLFLAEGFIAYSLIALRGGAPQGVFAGLLSLAFSLSYFLAWNALRLNIFNLFSKRRDKILAGIFSGICFGLFALLFLPDFPAVDGHFIASLPARIRSGYERAAIFACLYTALFFFVPNIGIGRKRPTRRT
ncbi:MAG: hypothetical protein SPI65_04760 [Peptoniphilus sp.]|nr:hypothetical protein [Peptoniphilus sp.]MDD7362882.1 hypothetical protein [Bacillota bacterium]MDY6044877.1 hypothetical protein [Peptoniphilus sp.]